MSEHPIRLLRLLESAAGWALVMATLSGAIIGAAIASAALGPLNCGG